MLRCMMYIVMVVAKRVSNLKFKGLGHTPQKISRYAGYWYTNSSIITS